MVHFATRILRICSRLNIPFAACNTSFLCWVRDRTGIVSTYIATGCKPLLHALAMEQEKEACEEASWHAARMEQSQQLHMEHMKLLSDVGRHLLIGALISY